MGKIAFVFSGQGDQYSGMGKDLADQYASAADVFKACDILRPGTSKQCFAGTDEELKETKNTQPCLFAVEMAAISVLKKEGIVPDVVAGFSLGEVVALTCSGAVSFNEGFSLVCKRAELMQEAAEKFDTSMAAVLKLSAESVKELCAEFNDVYPVNYNCPGQVTVAALTEKMTEFSLAVKAAGGRTIPLKVKGAFHSPYMAEASDAFGKFLKEIEIKKPETELYSNVTAVPYGDNIRELLAKQICSPVRWEEIIKNMISDGVDTFIEIGPGKTLKNMIKKISADVKTYAVCELPVILTEVRPC